jgi:chemotaxis protein methyltransferase CheR
MDKVTFDHFRKIVYEKSGITLHEGKESLVSARIGKRIRHLRLDSAQEYLDYVINDESGEELINLLDAISTNVTSFFREAEHFDFLKNIVKEWMGKGQKRFRIWSAASSTGEEPYTIAITMLDAISNNSIDMRILATDISTKVLDTCRQGIYSEEKLAGVPPQLRNRFFRRFTRGGETCYEAIDDMKKCILFKRLNLSRPPFPMKGPLDVVFCRNVMIYFDNNVRKNLLNDIHRLLKPGGYLMVGHAESLTGMVSDFKVVKPSVYIKA